MSDAPGKPRGRGHGRPWQPGQSGNPAGRPKGAKHAALLALDAIGEENAPAIMAKVVATAMAGDMKAAEILLKRLWPERKGRPVMFEMPEMHTAADTTAAVAAIASAVAAGELSPEEGQAVAAIVEVQRRTIETAELAAELAKIKEAMRL